MNEPQAINDILDDVIGAGDPVDDGTVDGIDAARALVAEGTKDLPEANNPYTFTVESVDEKDGDYGEYYQLNLRVTGSATGKYIGMGTKKFMNKSIKKSFTGQINEILQLQKLFVNQTGIDIWTERDPNPSGLSGANFQADVNYYMREGKRPRLQLREASL
tara:strand:+ start:1067 stop:1549 length:483 start_codon:yes stop_codon:yes gene_type:complete